VTIADDYLDWIQLVGTEDQAQGEAEGLRWIEEMNLNPEEMRELLVAISNHGTTVALAQGELLGIGPAIAYTAFRYGIDLEAKKHLPSL
jgi:hypothetical protein